jgi:hypothetical protein
MAAPCCKESSHEGRAPATLAAAGDALYLEAMTPVFNQTDRARLRERFYGATHTVLARL